jgi:hypothetical protein
MALHLRSDTQSVLSLRFVFLLFQIARSPHALHTARMSNTPPPMRGFIESLLNPLPQPQLVRFSFVSEPLATTDRTVPNSLVTSND